MSRGYLAPEVFAILQREWPQFFPEHANLMHVEGPKDDPVVNEVIEFLRKHGRAPHWERYPSCPFEHPQLYQVEGNRVFDSTDLDEAEYLAFIPELVITKEGSRKDESGRLLMKRTKINRQPIGRPSPWGVPVCKDSLKRELEAERFAGLAFQRVDVIGERPGDDPVWIMGSDREMPPLLNRLVCEDGSEYEFSKALGCPRNTGNGTV